MEMLKKAQAAFYDRCYQSPRHYDDFLSRLPLKLAFHHARLVKSLLLAVKIGVGAALAVLLANWLGLGSAVSAGTITLLTLAQSKKGTLMLIVQRFLSFFLSVFLCYVLYQNVSNMYMAYMLFLFLLAFVCEILGWSATLSVNAVIGAHFFEAKTFDLTFLTNEFLLICLAVAIAFVFNLFYAYNNMRLHLFVCRLESEKALYGNLLAVSRYLQGREELDVLKQKLDHTGKEDAAFLKTAEEYAGNYYSRAPNAYILYFKMRARQQSVLYALLPDLEKLHDKPCQALAVAKYIRDILPSISSLTSVALQEETLEAVKGTLEQASCVHPDLSVTHHVLLALQDLLALKAGFIASMSPEENALFFKDLSDRSQPDSVL